MENSLLCGIKCDLSIVSIWFDKVNPKIFQLNFQDLICKLSFSGQGVVYYIDELTASLQLAFKIQLSVENFPGMFNEMTMFVYPFY